MKKISIIVCTKDRPHKLKNCVNSIIKSAVSFYKDISFFEIIIFDQSKKKNRYFFSLSEKTNLKYIYSNTIGISIARNNAIKLAKFDILAFTDDDCIVDKEWITIINKKFEEYDNIKVIFGKSIGFQLSKDNQIHYKIVKHTYGYDWRGFTEDGKQCFAIILKSNEEIFYKPCLPYANFGSGNNMACKREVFEKYGLFSEFLGAGSIAISAEDTELQYRFLLSKLPILYSPEIIIQHNNWLNSEEAANQLDRYTCGTSAVFLYYGLKGSIDAAKYFFPIMKNNVLLSSLYYRKNGISYDRCRMFALSRLKFFLKGLITGIRLLFFKKIFNYLSTGK